MDPDPLATGDGGGMRWPRRSSGKLKPDFDNMNDSALDRSAGLHQLHLSLSRYARKACL